MMSEADCFVALPMAERQKRLARMTEKQLAALHWSWEWWGRPEQHAPTATAEPSCYWQYRDARWQHASNLASWTYWLCNAGRGWGKTRTGAEWTRRKIRTTNRVSLIAPTAHDIRAVMVEGPQGILNICPRGERPEYDPSLLRLRWPNGAISELFSADEPERLRGPAHGGAWCDELAAWRYLQEAWDQLQFGLRMGDNPQVCITTTPKNSKVFRDILLDPGTIVSRGTTTENRHNLAPTFLDRIVGRYEGTRLGRQELDAELLEDNPGALWKRSVIDANRVARCPPLSRIVVAVDPMGSIKNPDAECGIAVVGLGQDGHGYVLNDVSEAGKPDQWGLAAVTAFHANQADRIVAEVNFGGDMVEAVIRTVDANVPYKEVRASRGKAIRAEPVAALYEQGRLHHVGFFAKLEDEMCLVAGTMIETERGQIAIEDVLPTDKVMTRLGLAPLQWCGRTGFSKQFVQVVHSHGCVIMTPWHPVFDSVRSSFVPANDAQLGMSLLVSSAWVNTGRPSSGAAGGGRRCAERFISGIARALSYIGRFGLSTLDRFLAACMSTTAMEIRGTTSSAIFNFSLQPSTSPPILREDSLRGHGLRDPRAERKFGRIGSRNHLRALSAALYRRVAECDTSTAPVRALKRLSTNDPRPVYNLRVEPGHLPEFFANGVLVHNCDWNPTDPNAPSPNRLDAMVWAVTELMLGESTTGMLDWMERQAKAAQPAKPPIMVGPDQPRLPVAGTSKPAFGVTHGTNAYHGDE